MTTAPAPTSSPNPGDTRPTPPQGKAPVAAPAAGYVGTLLALLFLGAGVVALRDSAVTAGWLHGHEWTKSAIGWVDGLGFAWWMIPVGVVLVLAGLWFVYAAVRPRRRIAVQVNADSSVWIAPADLARLASQAAQSVPGVLDARSSASLRTLKVTASATAGGEVAAAVSAAVHDATAITRTPLKIRVRTRTGDR